MSTLFPILGASIALAGLDKLVGQRGYRQLFGHLDWSEDGMRAVAVAELAGGLLMVPAATRRFGGALVVAASSAVLSSELDHGDARLAVPRSVVLMVALAAVVAPARR